MRDLAALGVGRRRPRSLRARPRCLRATFTSSTVAGNSLTWTLQKRQADPLSGRSVFLNYTADECTKAARRKERRGKPPLFLKMLGRAIGRAACCNT
jgi:hypothetical protein